MAETNQTTALVKETQAELKRPNNLNHFNSALDSKKFVEICVASGLYKDGTDLAKGLLKITLGRALGIDEATAMQNILIVNGKMSFTSNLIATRIKQSGRYRYEVLKKDDKGCSIQFYEKVDEWTNDGKLIFKWIKPGPPETFTVEMAKRAGLSRNPTWTSWPEAMCFARCVTSGARTYTPDIFAGNPVYSPEELAPDTAEVNAQGEIVVTVDSRTTIQTPAIDKKTVEELGKLLKECKADPDDLLVDYGVKELKDLNPDQAADLKRTLQTRLKASAK